MLVCQFYLSQAGEERNLAPIFLIIMTQLLNFEMYSSFRFANLCQLKIVTGIQ